MCLCSLPWSARGERVVEELSHRLSNGQFPVRQEMMQDERRDHTDMPVCDEKSVVANKHS